MSIGTCVVLGTGGTIAGRAATSGDVLGYTAGQVGIDALLAQLPVPSGMTLVTEQVVQVDSKDMSHAVWQRLAQRCAHWLAQPAVRGLVVTHGTDTLEETAYFLHRVIAPSKPVVLTGAMRPASALVPDGRQNLLDALTVAAQPEACGVLVAFAGRVHGAAAVAKVHSQRLDAFDSGDAGPLAHVEAGRVRWGQAWTRTQAVPGRLDRVLQAVHWPRVEIVMNHVGAQGDIVTALTAQGVAGIVVAGTGNGTLATGLEGALREAAAHGVQVVRATRCAAGPVLGHEADALPAGDHPSPVKARIDLMLALLEQEGA